MTTEELRITVAPGLELRVLASGLGQSGTPFVLVHGLASNARMWDGVAAELVAAGHPVVWIDQRGHGQSDKPDTGYDFATIVNDLVVLITELGFSKPIVVGQSWGGNVVLELAATHPDVPGAVVAVDGGFIELASKFEDWDTCRAVLTPPHLVGTPAKSMERWVREGNADWPETGIIGAMANFEIRSDNTIAPWLTLDRHLAILEALYGHQPSARYALITVPTLLVPADSGDVAWAADKHAAVDAAIALLPNGRARWFAPAQHDIHAQYPVQLAEVLAEFAEEALPG
ncbi:MAG: alpha/beta hydrolase [Acidimicrobiales bacterium]